MKKTLLILSGIIALSFSTMQAQRFALVDIEYILQQVPNYEAATEQLNQSSKQWEKEIAALTTEAQTLYKNYQTEMVFLSDEMKVKREEAIIAKEKEAMDLKRTYFGADGELFKKRESLLKPIQEEIYNAVKELSESKNLQLILDRSSSTGIIFASPTIDISDEVLQRMGYQQ
ncbi:MAG: OmpH family outer membrane protein [Paludibacteraceae bacterium]|nr:OmpH family outer membrane protein [Paludibacteraceae bacterium]